jgi:hypothetical protein
MSGGIERQIFEDSGRPDPEIAPDRVTDAVSDAIRGLDRGDQDQAPRRQETPPAPPPNDGYDGDRSTSGLLKALLDEREKRQGAESRASRYEQLEREQKAKEQKPALSERLFADPDGTLNDLRQEIAAPLQQQIQQMQLNHDFALANVRYGETFAEAWNTWYDTVKDGKDATTYFSIMNSQSPAEAMVQWYRRTTRDKEVGEDLDAYKQRVIDEYLAGQNGGPRPAAPGPTARDSDGRFTARPQAPQRQPTSISRMGASGVADDDLADNDGSDAAIFAAATRPTNRQRRK